MSDQSNTTVSELLACPFCGSADIAHDGPSYTHFMCNDCGSATYEQDSHAEAIAAWNRRATADVTEAMVERACEAWRDCQGPLDLSNFMRTALLAALTPSQP